MLRALILVATLLVVAPGGTAHAQAPATTAAPQAAAPVDPNKLVSPPDLVSVPAGRKLTGAQATKIADALPLIREEVRKYPGSYSGVFLKGSDRWQVSYYSKDKPPVEFGQVSVWDVDGRVLEAYVGYKVPWTMARGYAGAFGRKVNSPWVWIPLSVLFLIPFVDPRRPFRLLHLDLLVLVGFGASVAFFNDAQISVSHTLVFPLLGYLLARMLWVGLRTRPEPDGTAFKLLIPTAWLVVAVIFLVGFRVGLNVTSSNVIDVGYAGVIGAQKLVDGEELYANWPKDNEHGDTYGPITYLLYVPFEQLLPWSGSWDDLPAAHAAAVTFDLLVLLLCFLVGRRVRGPALGVALAYAWAAFPFTLYTSNTNANDALVPLFLLLAILVAGRPMRRGAAVALGGLTKFATLAVAPLMTFHGERSRRSVAAFCVAFAAVAALAFLPVVAQGQSFQTVYDRTIGYQAERGAPFSIWGLWGWDAAQRVWQIAALALAVGIAFVPRRRDLIGLAACAAAVIIALQMGVTYWFYLYVVWFFPLVMLVLLARGPWSAAPARP